MDKKLETIFMVIDGNEYGNACMTDAFTTRDEEEARNKFQEIIDGEESFGVTLYKFNTSTLRFEAIESYCID